MAIFNLWGNTVPSAINVAGSFTLGHVFKSSVSGSAIGARFYKGSSDVQGHTGSLWSMAGVKLATGFYVSESASGWQSCSFSVPYTISASVFYMVTTHHPSFYSNNATCPVIGPYVLNPLSSSGTAGAFINSATEAFPTTQNTTNWEGVDVLFNDLGAIQISGSRSLISSQGVNGYLQGINLGGPTSMNGDSSNGRHLKTGVTQSAAEGNPSAPCLELDYPGMWRFRWAVQAGSQRTITAYAKQVSNVATQRPSLIIKADKSLGINADISGSAGLGTGWTTIGPVAVTPTVSGVVWVELWNNDTNTFLSPAFFDHIVST
jgi:hypothetical protein